jgi:hypothetical protein
MGQEPHGWWVKAADTYYDCVGFCAPVAVSVKRLLVDFPSNTWRDTRFQLVVHDFL